MGLPELIAHQTNTIITQAATHATHQFAQVVVITTAKVVRIVVQMAEVVETADHRAAGHRVNQKQIVLGALNPVIVTISPSNVIGMVHVKMARIL